MPEESWAAHLPGDRQNPRMLPEVYSKSSLALEEAGSRRGLFQVQPGIEDFYDGLHRGFSSRDSGAARS